MSGHKIDAEFIGKLTEARIAAQKEVETNTYYGHTPEARMVNFSAGIENGLGGDVGKFLGMLDPETVFLIVDELVVRRRRMRNIRTMADYDLEGQADVPTPMVSKSGTAVVIPNDDAEEARGVLEMCLGQGPSTLTLAVLARAVMNDHAGRVIALRSEISETKEQRDNYKQATQDLTAAVDRWAESCQSMAEERTAIMKRVTDWENAYQGSRAIEADLTSRVAQLINAYGSLYQSACEADKAHRGQDELLREVDVLGAYLKNPARETEAETRQMAVKAALTKIEEQDETIGALQQALVAAQSGQPRRPRGFTIKPEGAKQGAQPTEAEQLVEWAKKVMGNADFADPKVTLDRLLQHMFGK